MNTLKYSQLTIAFAILGASALATADTDTFTVSATVENSCVITAANLEFGTVNVLSGADVDGTSNLSVTCTNGAAYQIGLDGGGAEDVTSRVMSDGATGTLSYALYIDEARTENWGNTENTDTKTDTGSGSEQTHTVYGRVPQGQTAVEAGAYTDTVTATVYY